MMTGNPLEQLNIAARQTIVKLTEPAGLRPTLQDNVIYLDEGGQIWVRLIVLDLHQNRKSSMVRIRAEINGLDLPPLRTVMPGLGKMPNQALHSALSQWVTGVLGPVLVSVGAMAAKSMNVSVVNLATRSPEMDEARWGVYFSPAQITTTGGREVADALFKQVSGKPLNKLMLNAVGTAHHEGGDRAYHDVMAYVTRKQNGTSDGKVTFDQEVWERGLAVFDAFEWPEYDGLMAFRQFLFIKQI